MTSQLTDITGILRRGIEQHPDAEAVRFGEQSHSWRRLDDRVRRGAAAQRAAGLSPGDRVAFLDKNHPTCVETTLTCAMVGTVNAVVNFRLAPDEVSYVVNDAAARVLFVGPEFLPVVEQIRDQLPTVERVVTVGGPDDGYESWIDVDPIADPHQPAPDDCFLQLYTSGTTGFPKGAMLTHRGMLEHSSAVAADTGLGPDSVAMVAMPLFHVGGSSWALVALSAGARIVIVREPVPQQVLDGLERERITHTFFVPALLSFLVAVPDAAQRDYSALRCLCYGASPMPLPLLRTCLQVFPTDFYQVYGMTEAAGVVTMLGPEEHRDPAHEHRLVSAGKPISGVEIEIRDPATGEDPLAAGESGEVWVRTEQLMAGYWRKPDETDNVLVAGGWLRSGDAGHLDDDGYLYVTDRIKDMIISGGENIYPAEIERVLVEHPSVADLAVIGVPDEKWGEVPLAVVQAAPDTRVDEAELLAYCRARLASFKCPRSVTVVEALPRNPTGKILKKDLRTPYWEGRTRQV
ncbi:MAG: long-chain-fatty-acid--CoA ligase [Pseudonocardiaceae bacterium]|nr:long-chain-fatty-acid--CoA ligase [Pseudonocardiaceae bacterium]